MAQILSGPRQVIRALCLPFTLGLVALAEAPAVLGPLPLAACCLLGPGRRGCNHLREGTALCSKDPHHIANRTAEAHTAFVRGFKELVSLVYPAV